jgi:hypothetical protein
MDDITPIRFAGMKEAFQHVLYCKQGNGDSEVELIQWCNKMAGLWSHEPLVIDYIHGIRMSIAEAGEVIRRVKGNISEI